MGRAGLYERARNIFVVNYEVNKTFSAMSEVVIETKYNLIDEATKII